jgi:Cu(I)/Ag(I) efflux system periplasmic protein CusF
MKISKRALIALVLGIAGAFSLPAHAQQAKPQAAAKPSPDDMTDGEVRKVDKPNKSIVLKHGEVKSIGMAAMTMMWPVTNARLLDKLKPGDKVRFKVGYEGGTYVVTDIQPAK